MVFLSQQALEAMRHHKYVSCPMPPISRVLNWLIWERAGRLLPSTLAPNTITLISSVCIVSMTFLMLSKIDLNLVERPSALYLFLATAGYYFYHLLDILDGKQARKLGVSSPLGQMLDHGLDGSINTMLISIINCVMLSITDAKTALIIMLCTQTSFFWANWNEHYVGVLKYQLFGLGVDEFSHVNYVLLCLTCYYGYGMWDNSAFYGLNYREVWVYHLEILMISVMTIFIVETVYTKGISTLKSLFPILQMYWSCYILAESGVGDGGLILLMLSCGFMIGVLQIDFLISNTAKIPFKFMRIDTTSWFIVSNLIYYYRNEYPHFPILLALIIPSFTYYFIYIVGVMTTVSRYLDIPFFSIKKTKAN